MTSLEYVLNNGLLLGTKRSVSKSLQNSFDAEHYVLF